MAGRDRRLVARTSRGTAVGNGAVGSGVGDVPDPSVMASALRSSCDWHGVQTGRLGSILRADCFDASEQPPLRERPLLSGLPRFH